MKVLLVGINAKYIHSSLAIYSLRAYARRALGDNAPDIELGEYTINHLRETILQDIYRRKPDFIGFSCYIWNISMVESLLADVKTLLPRTALWFGGPEVSYDGQHFLKAHPQADGVMKGEGEETLARLLGALGQGGELSSVPGLIFRRPEGQLVDTGSAPALDISSIPFPYEGIDRESLAHRILYYESSRGCPFSCSYCLSSIDRRVRFRSMELVERELAQLLEAGVPQVKFVDRTFNCSRERALRIWRFIKEHDNGKTNFHFEIAADLLDEEAAALLTSLRPGPPGKMVSQPLGHASGSGRLL